MTNLKTTLAGIFVAGMLLTACGTTTSDRALSGGLIGAGAGAAVGSLSGNAGAGAVVGGVAGAAAGALTSPSQVDLGDPVWRSHHHCVDRDSSGECVRWAPND
ncbi:MAG: hypothetical protein WAU68_08785 [Vitreimonas sp.]